MLHVLDVHVASDQSLWVICAVFYLTDNLKFHTSRELFIAETLSGRWSLLFPISHYRVFGRTVTLLQPWLPFMATVKMPWLIPNALSHTMLRRTKYRLCLCQRRLALFRAISVVYFITLFVIGPAATHFAGLAYALTLVLPIHIIGVANLILLLVVDRRAWGIEWHQLFSLVFECAVCPGYFVNICRKVSIGYARVTGDAVAIVLEQSESRVDSPSACGIEMLLEDLAEWGELRPDDDKPIATYRGRLAEAASGG